jgi:hypothetical protein
MAKHLVACEKRAAAIETANKKRGKDQTLILLQARAAYSADYWLYLEMNGSAALGELDDYLRAIWLECCGHMSQFSVGGWRGEEIDFDAPVAEVFRPGVELTHIYDFGTESVTLVKALDQRQGKPTTAHPIALLARNAAPTFECQECGRPATHLCLECIYEEDEPGTLCDEHAQAHPHDAYGEPMPLVNSPRAGLCGYTGPAEAPY